MTPPDSHDTEALPSEAAPLLSFLYLAADGTTHQATLYTTQSIPASDTEQLRPAVEELCAALGWHPLSVRRIVRRHDSWRLDDPRPAPSRIKFSRG